MGKGASDKDGAGDNISQSNMSNNGAGTRNSSLKRGAN